MEPLFFLMAIGNFVAFYRDLKNEGTLNVTYLISSIVFFLMLGGNK